LGQGQDHGSQKAVI